MQSAGSRVQSRLGENRHEQAQHRGQVASSELQQSAWLVFADGRHTCPCHSAKQCNLSQSALHIDYPKEPRCHSVWGGRGGKRGSPPVFWTVSNAVPTCMTVLLMDISPGARCIMTGLRSHLAAASCKVSGIVAVNSSTCHGQAKSYALVVITHHPHIKLRKLCIKYMVLTTGAD